MKAGHQLEQALVKSLEISVSPLVLQSGRRAGMELVIDHASMRKPPYSPNARGLGELPDG